MSTVVEQVTRGLTTLADYGSVSSASSRTESIETLEKAGEGSLAPQLRPKNKDAYESGQINVVKNYPWTPSAIDSSTIPYVRLIEYFTNESMVKKSLDSFGKQISDTVDALTKGVAKTGRTLAPYDEIFDKSDPTDFSYWLPYFNKTSYEINTPSWQKIDGVGDSIKKLSSGLLPGEAAGAVNAAVDFATAASAAGLAWQYAGVGIFDRPRLFAGHSERQITISFPLYNTIKANDWIKNRDLIHLLMSQNHYNKRDMITGVPPVFYDVYIPGQYYCYAAAMTDIKVENLGNVRMIANEDIVPDAYQITLTLSEMTMPSKNQFHAITNGEGRSFVNSKEVLASGKARANVDKETEAQIEETRKKNGAQKATN